MAILAYDEVMLREPRLLVPGMQPLGTVRLSASPLSKSIAHFFIPGRGDLCKKTSVSLNGQSLINNKYGRCITSTNGAGANIGSSNVITSDGSGTGDFTWAVIANPITSSTRTIVLGSISGAAPETYLLFNGGASDSNASGGLAFFWYDPVLYHQYIYSTSTTIIDGERHAFFIRRSGATLSLFKDGVLIPATQFNGTASIYRAGSMYVGGYSSEGYGLNNARLECAICWNRALIDAEIMQITQDPYQFLIPA